MARGITTIEGRLQRLERRAGVARDPVEEAQLRGATARLIAATDAAGHAPSVTLEQIQAPLARLRAAMARKPAS